MTQQHLGRLLRVKDIVGDTRAIPPILPLVPVGKSTWWAGVKSGRFPPPIKLGPRITVWKADDIRKLLTGGSNG
ncbi:MAG: AlpA family phage regulatory protein [Bacteroidetes bacterium]|nr:AlpA family phage regulatory protein [Bacteroidota bacterium]